MTNAQGKFELRTIGELGVLPNDYSVIVVKNVMEVEKNPKPAADHRPPGHQQGGKVKSLIPIRYNNAKTSGLNFTVEKDGLKDVKIEIVD